LFVTVVGAANAGKSTLINTIIGEKVSIVSHRVQTTRRAIRGIATIGVAQVVFLDTPGFCTAASPLEKVLLTNLRKSCRDPEMILLVIDATSKNHNQSMKFVERTQKAKVPFVVVINKVDVAKREDVLKIASMLSSHDGIMKVFMVSALLDDGICDLKNFLEEAAQEGVWMYEDAQTTDSPLSFRLAEITREKIFLRLKEELPYSIYVETELFHESEKKATIYQSIVVMKDSQKGIVLGRNGTMIKSIKGEAIADMVPLLGKKVFLKLFVKVREKWTEKMEHLQNAGIV
jgi:GTP-binding protein Era